MAATESTRFTLVNPVDTEFFITNRFNAPRPYANGRHEGIDLRAIANGRPVAVLAAQRGVVDRIRTGGSGYGIYVRLRHEWVDGTVWVTWYAHMSAVQPGIRVGQLVEAGQRLGTAGSTGNSTGVHLHLTVQHLGHGLAGYVVSDVVDPTRLFEDVSAPVIDEASYVRDVTVPDGTILEAGKPFTKTWRIRNTGDSTWGSGYRLVHFSDERMSGPDSVSLPPLASGESGEVSVSLVAPVAPGRHRTTWKPQRPGGRLFPFALYADVVVTPVHHKDGAVLVADLSVPDGATVRPGEHILKTWRLRNTGDTTWGNGYSLALVDGSAMGAAETIDLPRTRPGAVIDLSIPLTAPAKTGRHRARWSLRNAGGKLFGDPLTIEIRVITMPGAPGSADGATFVADVAVPDGSRQQPGAAFTKVWRVRNSGASTWGPGYQLVLAGENQMGAPDAIDLPAAEPGDIVEISVPMVAPVQVGPHRGAWQARNSQGERFGDILTVAIEVVRLGTRDEARFVSDVTLPDGAPVAAGELRRKTWRIRNTGDSEWTSGYALAFVADKQMDAPDSVPLPAALPGDEVEVSVSLTTPTVPGLHRTTWRPRNAQGQLFGDLFYAEVRVATPTPGSGSVDDAALERHITFPDGTEVRAGTTFQKTWAVRNSGSTTWDAGYSLVFVGGTSLGAAVSELAVGRVAPQEVVNLTLELGGPDKPGRYIGRWRMRNPQGDYFGSTIFVSIIVVPSVVRHDLLAHLRGDGRLYEMKHIFEMPNGPLSGQQRVQAQRQGDRFYITKNREWEELWADERFIYRGTDTSPGSENFYTLMDGDTYGTPWVPRRMYVGQVFRRTVTVVSRRKGNCMVNSQLSGRHVTWIKFEAYHEELALPDVEGRPHLGLRVPNVVELAAYSDIGGRPDRSPFERYFYAKRYGMVMWQGLQVAHKGISFMVEVHEPGERPNNVRERIPCLEALLLASGIH